MEDPNWEMKEDFADLQDRMERIREIVTGKLMMKNIGSIGRLANPSSIDLRMQARISLQHRHKTLWLGKEASFMQRFERQLRN